MKRRRYRVVAALAAALIALACTPLGPLALARLLESGAGEWQVAVGGHEGSLLFGFTLAEIHCHNRALGLEAQIAALMADGFSREEIEAVLGGGGWTSCDTSCDTGCSTDCPPPSPPGVCGTVCASGARASPRLDLTFTSSLLCALPRHVPCF